MSDALARTYGVELIGRDRFTLDKASLLRALRRWCPGVEPLDHDEQAGVLAFVHQNHPIQLADARIAAQTFVAASDCTFSPAEVSGALEQTWDFDQAKGVLAGCTSSVLVTDLMSSSLGYRERIDVFQCALRGVLEVVSCAAIHWRPSQRIVAPAAWLELFDAGDAAHVFTAGAVNVRLFNVQGPGRAAGEIVMDTLGLGALGLPDLQCHFTQLNPTAVARVLFNTAWYIFERGDVIADGNTAQGITTDSRWPCHHEDALVGPARVVLDMNPGPPHAAGNRAG